MYTIVSNSHEAEGIALAQKHGWRGDDILYVTLAALTEANFHHEAKKINDLIDARIPF